MMTLDCPWDLVYHHPTNFHRPMYNHDVQHGDVQNQKIFFIVSGLLVMKIISCVIELPQIVYIYIFCQISSDLILNGDKIRGTLTEDVRQITKNLSEMSVFSSAAAQEQSIILIENEDFKS